VFLLAASERSGYKGEMEPIIDIHIHVGHRFEWTERAQALWMDTGPYVPRLFDGEGRQLPEPYGEVIKEEGVVGGLLIPEYSPGTAGVMPYERAEEIAAVHPELLPIANLNPTYQDDVMAAFEEQYGKGARVLKIHPPHGLFFANDPRLYPVYARCEAQDIPVMFHAGTTLFPGAKLRYADPYTFDDVINDFPGLKVVLCHGGRGFWYQIAEFLAKNFDNVYIDVSGLPPRKLLQFFPSMKDFSHKYLFGSDFPGVPGIRKNFEAVSELVGNAAAARRIGFQNAYDLFGFWKEGIREVRDPELIFEVVNDAARRYNGVIPADRWHEPYMPMEEVRDELQRMRFYGYVRDGKILGVIGKERVRDVTLLRHLYVRMDAQGMGIGGRLVAFVQKKIDTEWLLIGTWESARWAVDFYLRRDFATMPDKDGLLRNYWDIPDRQVETSVVLGKRMHPAQT